MVELQQQLIDSIRYVANDPTTEDVESRGISRGRGRGRSKSGYSRVRPQVFPFDHDNVQSISARTQKGSILPSICRVLAQPIPLHSQFMDKKLFVNLQGGRKVSGTLRGYDLFLNLVLDDAQEETTPAQRHPIGTVVRSMGLCCFATVCPLMHTIRSSAGTVLPRWK